MPIRKQRSPAQEPPFPGREHALDGHAAVYAVETMASEVVVVQSVPDLAEITGPLRNLAPRRQVETDSGRTASTREVDELPVLAALLTGYADVGLRTAAMASGLGGVHESLAAAAGKRLACVLHLTCRAARRQAGPLHGGHDEYYGASDTGWFQLFAKNVQEAGDFALIAHRVAEITLTPGICAQDFYRTTQSIQDVRLPDPPLVGEFLGRASDTIATPTPAQVVLFGEHRRRIPRLVDRDHPAGVGGVQDQDSFFKALAAQRVFFSAHLEEEIDTAMREFGRLTGRHYGRISGYRADDADVLVIAQGAVVEELESVVDALRSETKLKAGVINVTAFRPFPGPQLTQMLKGKRAVTVLDRSDTPLADDPPMLREVRCAVDKAVENGASDPKRPPHPHYASYRRMDDRPQFHSGIYGVGGDIPPPAELAEVFRNMKEGGKKRFYLGIQFERPTRRFPHLETLQQQLIKNYPDLKSIGLSAGEHTFEAGQGPTSFRLYSLSVQGGLFAGNLFAQTLADALGFDVRTFPEGGFERSLQPACFTLVHAKNARLRGTRPPFPTAVLVSSDHFVEHVASGVPLGRGGTIIIQSSRNPRELWQNISRRAARWVKERAVRMFALDARAIALDTASSPSFIDQLAVWALFGGYLKAAGSFSFADVEKVTGHLRIRLGQLFGETHYLVEDIAKTLMRGYEELAPLEWEAWRADGHATGAESDAPWTVQEGGPSDGTVFDVKRFWHSVGYLYGSGQQDETLADPYLATGIIPAQSSAFRDMTSYRLKIPQWLPENCTACGLCWAHCPESALPATIQTISVIVENAIAQCSKRGAAMVQMNRLRSHLAKQAHRLIARDGLHHYLTVGPLLNDAFSKLTKGMGLEGEKLDVVREEFRQVVGRVEHLPVAKSETFFDGAEKKEKGSGILLSIALNPLSCTGCGICVDVCGDRALELVEQTGERLEACNDRWRSLMDLPEVPDEALAAHISPADPDTQVHRLLNKTAYHSMVGGDGSFPGNGVKTAVHLFAATVESVFRPRFRAHVEKLDGLIERLENRIQGRVAGVLDINDFDEFAKRLSKLEVHGLTAATLAKLLGEGDALRKVDQGQLERLSALLGRLKEQRRLYLEGAGGGRSRMVLALEPDSAPFWSGTYPYNPHPHPWICHVTGDAPALAESVFEGIAGKLAEEIKDCRIAELEIEDAYVPAEHDSFFAKFNWEDFNGEERGMIPPVVVLGRSETLKWEAMTRVISKGYPIRVILINTTAIGGAHGTRSDPVGGSRRAIDPALLAYAGRDLFVLQGTAGNPGHLIQGIAESLSQCRPALFHVYAPDPHVSGIAPEKVAEHARLAFRSRAFPLFKIDPEGAGNALVLDGNPDPGGLWTLREFPVREPSGAESTVSAPLTVADWAVRELRFREHFRIVPTGELNDHMKPLSEYLDLSAPERQGLLPYIHVADEGGRHFLAIPSMIMIGITEERRANWSRLMALAASGSFQREAGVPPLAEAAASSKAGGPRNGTDAERAAYERVTERLLWLSGFSKDPDFFKQSLREFITRNREAEGGD